MFFISQLLHETRLLVAIMNTTSDYTKKEKNRLCSTFTKAVLHFFFFLQWTVANLNGTIEKFKIPVIVLLQWIIRDQTLCYYHQLHLWCNLHLLFSRFAKNRGLLGRTVSFSLQQWHFILCYHSLYAEGMWVWEKWMELSSLLKKKLNNQIKIFCWTTVIHSHQAFSYMNEQTGITTLLLNYMIGIFLPKAIFSFRVKPKNPNTPIFMPPIFIIFTEVSVKIIYHVEAWVAQLMRNNIYHTS